MTSPVITIAPYTPITNAAERMAEQAINRLPVTSGDKLVGIVTRADLVRAFARSEKDVAQDVHDQLEFQRALTRDGEGVEATVVAGEVTLSGHVRRRTGAEGLPRIIRNIPGVINVRSEVTWSEDT